MKNATEDYRRRSRLGGALAVYAGIATAPSPLTGQNDGDHERQKRSARKLELSALNSHSMTAGILDEMDISLCLYRVCEMANNRFKALKYYFPPRFLGVK